MLALQPQIWGRPIALGVLAGTLTSAMSWDWSTGAMIAVVLVYLELTRPAPVSILPRYATGGFAGEAKYDPSEVWYGGHKVTRREDEEAGP